MKKGEFEKAVCYLPSELRIRDWANRYIGAVAATVVLAFVRWLA